MSIRLILAILILLAMAGLGLWAGLHDLGHATTDGQRLASIFEITYGIAGLVSVAGLLLKSSWSRRVLWLWAFSVTFTATLAPVVWGNAPWSSGLLAGTAGALIAGLVLWLARPERRVPLPESR